MTPLMVAAAHGHHKLLESVLDKIKDLCLPAQMPKLLDPHYSWPGRQDLSGRSALLIACARLRVK